MRNERGPLAHTDINNVSGYSGIPPAPLPSAENLTASRAASRTITQTTNRTDEQSAVIFVCPPEPTDNKPALEEPAPTQNKPRSHFHHWYLPVTLLLVLAAATGLSLGFVTGNLDEDTTLHWVVVLVGSLMMGLLAFHWWSHSQDNVR